MGFKVLVEAGMGTKEVRYPYAVGYEESDGWVKFGKSKNDWGSLSDIFSRVNEDKVILIEDL